MILYFGSVSDPTTDMVLRSQRLLSFIEILLFYMHYACINCMLDLGCIRFLYWILRETVMKWETFMIPLQFFFTSSIVCKIGGMTTGDCWMKTSRQSTCY